MCGIIGIVGKSNVNQTLYDALTIIQHRGQDAAGITTCDEDNGIHHRKDNGLVREVFHTRHMVELTGNFGIGHVRYTTTGEASKASQAQPFYTNCPYGISLAHNGNLINPEQLKTMVFKTDLRHISSDSDSEILLNVFAHELQQLGSHSTTPAKRRRDIFYAISRVHERCLGAYAAVAMIIGTGIVGFRDPFGIRPIIVGQKETSDGTEYMIASESVALHALDFEVIRDLKPGEAVFITLDGKIYFQQCAEDPILSPCIFEYVYLARPDSFIDGSSVYKSRLRMADKLADKILSKGRQHDIDVVIPIPDTSRACALPLAYRLGIKYREGLIKNRYIPRTFIMPGQEQRKKSVRQKLNAIGLEFKDKNVLLVDDSIVRGTTSKEIIQMAREAGAKKVYFASAAPPIRYQNVYGINMPTTHELIAHGRTESEICEQIGADTLFYQNLDDLISAVGEGFDIPQFDTSCFTGEYVTGGVTKEYLEMLNNKP